MLGLPGFRQSYSLSYHVKHWFFDRAAVISRLDKKTHRAMLDFGRYVRRSARSSIKNRSLRAAHRRRAKQMRRYEAGKLYGPLRNDIKRSAPGDPPFSWQPQEPNIKTILYSYDNASESVVVGPIKLDRTKTKPPVPHTLEYGGTTEIEEYRFPGQTSWIRGRPPKRRSEGWKNRRPADVRRRRSNVAARPFMNPALRKEAPKFPELFRK
jgi:hypothetical protein